MSDAGLYGGIYEQLRRYADRLDRDLVLLRSADPGATSSARKDLAELLHSLTAKQPERPSERLVALILDNELRRQYGQGLGTCESLASVLNGGTPSADDIAKLESIAAAVDRECTNAMARLRGQT